MRYLLLLALLSACATKPKEFNYADSMKREGPLSESRKIVSSDGQASFEVETPSKARFEHGEQGVEFYYSAVDIGSVAPLECSFYKTDINPASSLKRLSNSVLGNKDLLGEVTKKEIAFIDAGVMNGTPFLQLDTSYITKKDGAEMVGYFKTMVAIKGRDSIVCWHNDLGFKQTFRTKTSQIVSSYAFKHPDAAYFNPRYSEVIVYKIMERPIGFSYSLVLDANNNSKVWINRSSILALTTNLSEISSVDDSQVEVSGSNGMLTLGKYTSENDLQVGHAIDVTSQNGTVYHVKGLFKGKDITTFMKTPGLTSNYQLTKMAGDNFFKNKKKAFKATGYVPSLSPVKPVDINYKLKEMKKDSAWIDVKIGEINNQLEIKENGTSESVTIPIGPVKIEGTRIYEKGSL